MAMTTKSYTEARAHLAELLDQVINDREPVLITRRGSATVAVIAADELDSLLETVHLLRSRANAERLLGAIERTKTHPGKPTTIAEIKAEFGLDDE